VAWTAVAKAHGFSHGYLVAAGITLLALVMIRVRREDLSGVNPMAAPSCTRCRFSSLYRPTVLQIVQIWAASAG
jgi:hypothetical protein